ncbi:MAG: NADP-dependent phosphogluconate dehydrogenase [Atribacterota bacterium]|nr:NADP-dependent phosphogluconate dehydrogenase [Atribacterota bacterium]MDD5637879.1 NADP-dependent phosphogluconate dehydrogenase [Atribacterota bacterium]
MEKSQIGLVGLGVMGQNLTLNIEDKGYSISVYNRTAARTEEFAHGSARGKNITPTYSLEEFMASLERPRRIILLVQAGQAVDDFIEKLIPLMDEGDLIIDGGNSFFKDTVRRNKYLAEKGFLYIGTGISGGEEGALKGPAIMPGGQEEAYQLVQDLLEKISAKAVDNKPCVSYIGPHGAGHYVKMVHNGIEYGDMQLIGECVWALKKVLGLTSEEIAEIFQQWNAPDDVLCSYLIEITAESMREKDKKENYPLIDIVADITRMKGTGTWTVQSALELLVPIPTITAAVFSREMSQDKDLRIKLSRILPSYQGGDRPMEREMFVQTAHDALYIAKLSSYAQGMALLQAASKEYQFNLNLKNIVEGWRAGCIIRAQFLDEITKAYQENPDLINLLVAPRFLEVVRNSMGRLATFIKLAHQAGVPIPAMDNSFNYILQLGSSIMVSAQVTAIQRDYFGAHGYFKLKSTVDPEIIINKDNKWKEFHTQWMLPGRPEEEL